MQFLPKHAQSKISTLNTAPDKVFHADARFLEVPNEWYNCAVQDCNQQSSVCEKKCGQLASWLSCMITKMQQELKQHPSATISIQFPIHHGTAVLQYGGTYWGIPMWDGMPGWDLAFPNSNHPMQNYRQVTDESIRNQILSIKTGEFT